MIIREAVRDDLPDVIGLLREDVIREVDESGVDVDSYVPAFEEITEAEHLELLVGVEAEQVVATAQLTWMRHLSYVGGLKCHVESVRVRSDLRGRGLGRELMEHVLAEATRRGAARVELTSNVQRGRAHAFYAGLGFVASHVGMKYHLQEGT